MGKRDPFAFLTDELLAQAGEGRLEALAKLDEHGLFLAPGEDTAAFVVRLQRLRANLADLERDLDAEGEVDFYGVPLAAADRVSRDFLFRAQEQTRKLYAFALDWVPAFFADYRMGALFAGCAYYSHDDAFALFIVRKSFQNKEKWLIYSRGELIAHEVCHVARAGFRSRQYEELLAYQTAESAFRRCLGGVFRSQRDTWILMASVLALAAIQIANVSLRWDSPWLWYSYPMPLFLSLPFLPMLYVFGAYARCLRRFRAAVRRLGDCVAPEDVLPVVYRCTDQEIDELALLPDAAAAQAWWAADRDWRWRVIRQRFARA